MTGDPDAPHSARISLSEVDEWVVDDWIFHEFMDSAIGDCEDVDLRLILQVGQAVHGIYLDGLPIERADRVRHQLLTSARRMVWDLASAQPGSPESSLGEAASKLTGILTRADPGPIPSREG